MEGAGVSEVWLHPGGGRTKMVFPRRSESPMELLGLIALGLTTLGLIVYAEFSEMS